MDARNAERVYSQGGESGVEVRYTRPGRRHRTHGSAMGFLYAQENGVRMR